MSNAKKDKMERLKENLSKNKADKKGFNSLKIIEISQLIYLETTSTKTRIETNNSIIIKGGKNAIKMLLEV